MNRIFHPKTCLVWIVYRNGGVGGAPNAANTTTMTAESVANGVLLEVYYLVVYHKERSAEYKKEIKPVH